MAENKPMISKKITVFEKKGGPWRPFLEDYFSDVPVSVHSVKDPAQAASSFDQGLPRVVFVSPDFLNKVLIQKILVRKHTAPSFRVYQCGAGAFHPKGTLFDGAFPDVPVPADFNKHFTETLPMPEMLRLLVVDDEEEIGTMVRDYFAGRKAPAFAVTCVPNGKEALAAIALERPDVIILDIKMPGMDGREFYAKLQATKREIPVIVFFDSISGEELSEMRRFGNPAVIEKGDKGSSLFAMMLLAKKMVYFST
jgi:CheY-like chemotaxis protein